MEVISQVQLDQLVQDCIVFVNWAKVASMYGTPGANGQSTILLSTTGGLQVPLDDKELATLEWTWVLEDLPLLGWMGTTLTHQFLQQNAMLGNLLQQQVDVMLPTLTKQTEPPKSSCMSIHR